MNFMYLFFYSAFFVFLNFLLLSFLLKDSIPDVLGFFSWLFCSYFIGRWMVRIWYRDVYEKPSYENLSTDFLKNYAKFERQKNLFLYHASFLAFLLLSTVFLENNFDDYAPYNTIFSVALNYFLLCFLINRWHSIWCLRKDKMTEFSDSFHFSKVSNEYFNNKSVALPSKNHESLDDYSDDALDDEGRRNEKIPFSRSDVLWCGEKKLELSYSNDAKIMIGTVVLTRVLSFSEGGIDIEFYISDEGEKMYLPIQKIKKIISEQGKVFDFFSDFMYEELEM